MNVRMICELPNPCSTRLYHQDGKRKVKVWLTSDSYNHIRTCRILEIFHIFTRPRLMKHMAS